MLLEKNCNNSEKFGSSEAIAKGQSAGKTYEPDKQTPIERTIEHVKPFEMGI